MFTIPSVRISDRRSQEFIRYKAEAMPQGESIQDFCLKNKVPYNLFNKWYMDTRHHNIPVHVEGQPQPEASSPLSERQEETEPQPVKIMIDIRMSNGIHIQQRNQNCQSLKRPVEKLEVLC